MGEVTECPNADELAEVVREIFSGGDTAGALTRPLSNGERYYILPERTVQADHTKLAVSRQALTTAQAEIEALRAENRRLIKAGNALSIAAQTTGGVAGRDEGLVAAIDGWSAAKAINRIERFEPDGTLIGAGIPEARAALSGSQP